MLALRTTCWLSLWVAIAACGREPLEWTCPDVDAGELVLTEIRGPQLEGDAPDWFEVYNASGEELDLRGAHVFIQRLDGSSPRTIIVRDSEVIVGAGEYAVLGNAPRGETPDHIDYGYADDFSVDLYDTAAVEITACGEEIDQVSYRNLPREGSHAFDGALEPDAGENSDRDRWCTDGQLFGDGDLVGTPGASNRECPAGDEGGEG